MPRASEIPATATILDIVPRVLDEIPERIQDASNGWFRFSAQLTETEADLDRHYAVLKATWTGDAAAEFDRWVARTKASIAEWKQTSEVNAKALSQLWQIVESRQQHVVSLFDEFLSSMVGVDKSRIDSILAHYTERAVSEVLVLLDEAYRNAVLALSTGTRFAGPTNALLPTE